MEINGKNIILTGASSGIGKILLEKLASYNGVKIVAVARHTDSIPVHTNIVYPFSADVSKQEGVDSLFDYATRLFGETDIFIANAGYGYLEKLENPDWKHIEDIFSLNVFSPVYSLEKFIQQAGKPKVFVSTVSGAGLASLPYYSLYCATKAALHHFMQTYRYESPHNIHLVSVYPVATRTDFFDKAGNTKNAPMPFPVQKPEKVAEAIIKGIEKEKRKVYPSLLFRLFYPIGRAFPYFMRIYADLEKRKLEKWMKKKADTK